MKIGSPAFPLNFDSKDVFKDVGSMRKLVKFHLTNLLLTNKGEKITNPDYGVGIRRYLFEPIVEEVIDSIKENIESQVNLYLSYLTIEDVAVYNPPDSNSLNIAVKYNIDSLNKIDVLALDLSRPSGADSSAVY